MNENQPPKIKPGADPRTLPDYVALRDELNKLTHPARPDVNWHHAEKLCRALLAQNGADLQTLSWYTLTRTQRAGLAGMNEGLVLLEALINHSWGAFWPQAINVRLKILNSLSQRLLILIRALPLNDRDHSQYARAEQLLASLNTQLQRLELQKPCQFDTLRLLVHSNAARLENSDGISAPDSDPAPDVERPQAVYIAEERPSDPVPEPQPNQQASTPVNSWKFFLLGMATMLAVSAAAVAGWWSVQRPATPESALDPFPAILAAGPEDARPQRPPDPLAFITETQLQLARLDSLPPGWTILYGRQLVEQAQALWPDQAESLAREWQQQIDASALPKENLEGWHQGMTKLKQLSDRLSGLDEVKGQYMTISELKSIVFATMQSFNQAIPAEEQLRVLALTPAGEPLPLAKKSQLEMHLKQLTTRYAGMMMVSPADI